MAEQVLQRPSTFAAIPVFLGRLERWKRFFESAGGDILSESAVQGLLGELLFLRDFSIAEQGSHQTAVVAWAVPEPLSKDFQYSLGAVEVKCSIAREHTKVQIHGERQLDPTGYMSLYLVAVLLDRVTASGFTLPETVASIREILKDGPGRGLFEEKLLAFGCLDAHFPHYDRRYILQRLRAFHVGEGFPRVPSVLPNGVGDLTYTISLAACAAYEVELKTLRSLIRESESK